MESNIWQKKSTYAVVNNEDAPGIVGGVFGDINVWLGPDAAIHTVRHFIVFGPIGSEDRYVVVHRTTGGGHRVIAGCWNDNYGGTLDELEERITSGLAGWDRGRMFSRHEAEYLAFISLARLRIKEWEEDG